MHADAPENVVVIWMAGGSGPAIWMPCIAAAIHQLLKAQRHFAAATSEPHGHAGGPAPCGGDLLGNAPALETVWPAPHRWGRWNS